MVKKYELQNMFSEQDLEMLREKPKVVTISVLYRSLTFLSLIFGKVSMLRFCLKNSWISHRVAYELSGEVFGDQFANSTLCLSEVELQKWISSNSTVIDIGCGTGRWTRIVAKYARKVTGIDTEPAKLQIARQESTSSNIAYVNSNIFDYIGRSNPKYDVALLIHVIEHIDDVDSLLRILRSVAPVLIIEVPDFDSNPLNRVRYSLNCPYYHDHDHVREYTSETLAEQVERNGWKICFREIRGGAILIVVNRI